jgi:2-polyprenyl-6-methoxyphenol hydroxylase-like FAD-dependent oxidoreductase
VRVIVVGGGIGGLCAAIALRRAGHEVTVLERTGRLEAAGAGITLFSNAMRALEHLNMRGTVAERAAAARKVAILLADGRELASTPPDLFEGAVAVHRGDLQEVLAQAAGEVLLGTEVVGLDDSAVRLADGSDEDGDLVVGADGVHSVVRRQLWPETAARFAGYTAWRGIADFSVEPGRWTESWGSGERFGLIDLGRRGTYWFATKNAPEGEGDEPGGRREELLRRFRGWHAPIAAVLDAAREDTILRNDVYYLDPLPAWSKGRVVLLGDAAHATTPGIGQGAAQAIEDAVVLARCLAERQAVPEALADYEARRRPRATRVLKMSRRADKGGQLEGRLACAIRNTLVRLMPASAQRRQLRPIVDVELEQS